MEADGSEDKKNKEKWEMESERREKFADKKKMKKRG